MSTSHSSLYNIYKEIYRYLQTKTCPNTLWQHKHNPIFLMLPVSLYAASSLDKKVTLAPAEVQPEEQGAKSYASQTDRPLGLKTSSVGQAAPL